jgi:hypothetical protein
MKSLTHLLLALTVLGVMSVPAAAGKRANSPVQIIPLGSGGTVSGALGATRNGSGNQYLGCWIELEGNSVLGGCTAKGVAASPVVSCGFPTGAMKQYLAQLMSINSDSYIQFTYEPNSANCPAICNGPPPSGGGSCPMTTSCCKWLGVYSFSYDQPKQ